MPETKVRPGCASAQKLWRPLDVTNSLREHAFFQQPCTVVECLAGLNRREDRVDLARRNLGKLALAALPASTLPRKSS
jgi:hypothetical protein